MRIYYDTEFTSLDEAIKSAPEAAESEFWRQPGNQGMIHHALYDARRLKLLAETQRNLYASL